MRSLTMIGAILALAGLAALILPYIPFTTEETVLELGPVEARAERERSLRIPPFVGILLLLVGAGLMVFSRFRR